MADADKVGTIWSDNDLDAIVADYFAMLSKELSGTAYVKSQHSAALMAQIGRTHRSVEFKHQNISAVLEELGMPWIRGYKPKRNYQNAIFEAIDRYLTRHGDPAAEMEVGSPSFADQDVFVDPPMLRAPTDRPVRLERLVRKFDAVERDFRNRTLGKAGEAFVLELERKRLAIADRPDLAERVRWIADEEGDGAGFDILSFEESGTERLIEVKTTNGAARTPFFLTRNEHDIAAQVPDRWQLYRVHLFKQSPRVFTLRPPLAESVNLSTETWRASWG